MKDTGLRVALMLTATGAIGCNDQQSPTAIESQPALATATASLSFFQMSAGDHACGITSDSRLYCWGRNADGELGDGTTIDRARPVPIASSLRFRQVSIGLLNTCAVTTDSRALCWGDNSYGQLGDGTTTRHLTPHEVTGGRQYRQVDAKGFHTCAIAAADDRAYCWGYNLFGPLGIGESPLVVPTPTAVAGGRQYRQVQVGIRHSCAVTMSNQAFCWGDNSYGAVGDSADPGPRYTPVRVAGAHQFVQIDAGTDFTCAITTTNRAFCWGDGGVGEIGDGKDKLRFWPRAVIGGLTFRRVSTGFRHACGETPSGKVYCWGENLSGSLGDGTTIRRLRPVAVIGGLNFSQVSAGLQSTCGRTPAGVGYCWGGNAFAQLGDGTHTDRSKPVKVVAPS